MLDKINKILGNWAIQIKLKSDSKPTNDLEVIWNYLHGELQILGDYTDVVNNTFSKKWLKYHYALQPISIPKNNNQLTLDKLLQIGFNLGRFSTEIKDLDFYGRFIDFYNLNQLDNINTYVKISSEKEKQIESNSDLKKFIIDINNYIIGVIGKLQSCSLEELQEEKKNQIHLDKLIVIIYLIIIYLIIIYLIIIYLMMIILKTIQIITKINI